MSGFPMAVRTRCPVDDGTVIGCMAAGCPVAWLAKAVIQ
jgi:hypothetical protein